MEVPAQASCAPGPPAVNHCLACYKYINTQITSAVNSTELPAVRLVLITLKINSILLWPFFAKPLYTLQANEDELENILNTAINRR